MSVRPTFLPTTSYSLIQHAKSLMFGDVGHGGRPLAPSLRLKALAAVTVLTALSACASAEEFRGEVEDCTHSPGTYDAVLLVDRAGGEVVGGWITLAFTPTLVAGAELEKVDSDGGALKFEAEFAGDGRLDLVADLEFQDDAFAGSIELSTSTVSNDESCSIKLERQSF